MKKAIKKYRIRSVLFAACNDYTLKPSELTIEYVRHAALQMSANRHFCGNALILIVRILFGNLISEISPFKGSHFNK